MGFIFTVRNRFSGADMRTGGAPYTLLRWPVIGRVDLFCDSAVVLCDSTRPNKLAGGGAASTQDTGIAVFFIGKPWQVNVIPRRHIPYDSGMWRQTQEQGDDDAALFDDLFRSSKDLYLLGDWIDTRDHNLAFAPVYHFDDADSTGADTAEALVVTEGGYEDIVAFCNL